MPLVGSVLEQVGQMFTNASSNAAAQNAAGAQLIPDLIYIGETNGSGARLLSAAEGWSDVPQDSGQFHLLTTPADASNRPVQALQVLLDRLMHIQANGAEELPEEGMSDNDRMLIDFLNGRLDPERLGGMRQIAGTMVQAEVREAAMAESVRQVQAMMADMAERLQGQVLMDPKNLRAVMHLEPPILGRVHVALQIGEDGMIVAHMSADQSATQDFLQENESEFRQGLANHDQSPDDIEIVFDDDITRAFGWELNEMATA
jgi:flagellar hook-length control protein FliK